MKPTRFSAEDINAQAQAYYERHGRPPTPSALRAWMGRQGLGWPKAHDVEAKLAAAFPTLEAPAVQGYTVPEGIGDIENVWAFADTAFSKVDTKARLKAAQVIHLPEAPTAVALFSDLHIGNPGTNYARIKADAELVASTPGFYAGFLGDLTDNWIVGKLTGLQKSQAVEFALERRLAEDWIQTLLDKFIFWVHGNHDKWTAQVAGVDPFQAKLAGKQILFDEDELTFDLQQAERNWRVVARHMWLGRSILNPTHALERAWKQHGYDIAIGAHTHPNAVCREFYERGQKRYAIQLSSYKAHNDHARTLGFAPNNGVGSAALVFAPGHDLQWFADINTAAVYLEFLRSPYGSQI